MSLSQSTWRCCKSVEQSSAKPNSCNSSRSGPWTSTSCHGRIMAFISQSEVAMSPHNAGVWSSWVFLHIIDTVYWDMKYYYYHHYYVTNHLHFSCAHLWVPGLVNSSDLKAESDTFWVFQRHQELNKNALAHRIWRHGIACQLHTSHQGW